MSLSEEYIKKRLNFINELREEAMFSPGNLELAEELRFVSDIYDVRILSEIAGVNTDYFYESIEDWNILLSDVIEKDIIFSFVLPKINNAVNH